MLKNLLIALAILIVVILIGGYIMRDTVVFALMGTQISPDHDFDPALAPAAPDYNQPSSWAALPDIADPSDDRPDGVTAPEDTTAVGVFFVHPTSYLSKANWNQPLDHEDANWIVDHRVLRHQASVFNSCCEIYAPRYRQATFFSFMDLADNGEKALDLAFEDVARAFDNFITTRSSGRPFILAGHSQGTMHAARLLREKIAGTALEQKLVTAYLIGFSIEKDQIGTVPVCTTATQTGCVVAWNAHDSGESGLFPDADDLICTNPLTWAEDEALAASDLNKGGIGYPSYQRAAEGEDYQAMVIEPGAADAQCLDGMLSVAELRSDAFPSRMPGGSMHVYDYSLYHMNIRENAAIRTAAFLVTR